MNEITVLIIVGALLGLMYYFMISGHKFKKRDVIHRVRPHVPKPLDRAEVAERWQAIETAAQRGEHGLKSAINDADKLLDQVIKQTGAKGETMAERLKAVESRFTNKEGIWRAHKLRNAIAHEIHFDIVMSQGRQALDDLQRGLKDLGAL